MEDFSMRRHTRILIPAALLALATLAVSTFGAGAATLRHAPMGPTRGGTIHVAYAGSFASFDPAQAFSQDWWVMMATLYNGLYQYDRNANPQLDLAAGPPVISADHKVWTCHMLKGVRFSNGQPVTANDLKYSITRTLDPHLKPGPSWGQPTDLIF